MRGFGTEGGMRNGVNIVCVERIFFKQVMLKTLSSPSWFANSLYQIPFESWLSDVFPKVMWLIIMSYFRTQLRSTLFRCYDWFLVCQYFDEEL